VVASHRPRKSLMNTGLRLLLIVGLAQQIGCNQSTLGPFRGTAKPASSEKTTEHPVLSTGEVAQEGQGATTKFNFAQVSLFGDLPGLPTASHNQSNGTSLEQHTFVLEGTSFDPTVSSDGRMLAFASTQHNIKPDIYIKTVGSTMVTQLTSDPNSDVQPTFSPDGKRIAFCSERTGNWDIFLIDSDGRNLQQLTDDPTPEMHPSFSSDGSELAYCRYNMRSGQWEIWSMTLPGGQKRFITAGLFPAFSPTEAKIVYQRAPERGSHWFSLWKVEYRDNVWSKPTELASGRDHALICPHWSADGHYVAYCAVKGKENSPTNPAVEDAQIWMVREDGNEKMPLTDPGIACYSPVWSPNGSVYFCSNRGGSENIWSVLPILGKNSESAEANKPVKLDIEANEPAATRVEATHAARDTQ